MSTLTATRLGVRIGAVSVCKSLDLTLSAGQCWGLLGRNGSGKTTLLHTLAGLRSSQSGGIELDGLPLTALPRRTVAQQLGMLLQEEGDPFPATVLETALIGRHPFLGRWAWEDEDDVERARQALRQMGVDTLAPRLASTLSGGERRRLALATLLTQDPDVLLLDEPTNHLDLHHQIQVLDHLRTLATDRGKSLLIVLHDINLATRYCDHLLLLLGEGETITGPTPEIIDAATLETLYRHPVTQIRHQGRDIWLPR